MLNGKISILTNFVLAAYEMRKSHIPPAMDRAYGSSCVLYFVKSLCLRVLVVQNLLHPL